MNSEHGEAIALGLVAAFFFWRFWNGKEYGYTRFGSGIMNVRVERKTKPWGFAIVQTINLLVGLVFGGAAILYAVR